MQSIIKPEPPQTRPLQLAAAAAAARKRILLRVRLELKMALPPDSRVIVIRDDRTPKTPLSKSVYAYAWPDEL